ncbi:tripeptidyl peptidase [Histoplasma capsulatum G186AR]|uniref:tripeptidyl-peptidase II n=1 Tax=Ajellomyces capsulatus (strain G186AR / H82 / ATCC MYA-2454 / RMSCC 2432) TaxID=447093 RepID=C0NAM4_AJECG|nr:tripeptidyl peptidase [Histoplasma capsulatum G186AR]EEH10715.1 tripeptidyl peptidase [Histoplasma capsulatum G186AR]
MDSRMRRASIDEYLSSNWSCAGPIKGAGKEASRRSDALASSIWSHSFAEILPVSDPLHKRYGKFLTRIEAAKLLHPGQDAINRTQAWLENHGISIHRHRFNAAEDWLRVTVSIAEAERLLDTKYYIYRYGNRTAARAMEWSLPQYLHDVIDTIQPTTSFMRLPVHVKARQNEDHEVTDLNQLAEDVAPGTGTAVDLSNIPPHLTPQQACNASAVTPLCLRTLYGTLYYKASAKRGTRMALVNYLGEFNNRSDISQFLKVYRPDALAGAESFEDISINGGINQQSLVTDEQYTHGSGREGNLDAEVMIGIAHPIPLTTYTVGESEPPFTPDSFTPTNTNEPFLTWLNWILDQPDSELPSVVSTSYGDIEHTVPISYARRVCNGFAQLGARGVSVIMGSGDHGVGHPGDCYSNDGLFTPEFLVSFPDSCPWVTSVGATKGIQPEVVAVNSRNGFSSGGGFSNYFPRPDYQTNNPHSVARYLSKIGGLHSGMFNPYGRAIPDVSTQGYRYVTIWNGETKLVDGTSASTPTFAAVVALVNDALAAEDKPPLGFLNPWLYAEGYRAFRDINEGTNGGCNTTGFPALQGWDAASGWGTPWFPKFKELALKRRSRETRPWYIQWFL